MPMIPAQTSGTSSSGTQASSRWAILGLVDSPPPTQTSKPGPCSGCSTPMNDTSFTSCATSCCQEIAVLNLRGRFENSLLPMYRSRIRSEEHTSELQSRQYLVCRLLLEKKK